MVERNHDIKWVNKNELIKRIFPDIVPDSMT